MSGLGPHNVIGTGEAVGTVVVFAMAIMAMMWMAFHTRRKPR